MRIPAAPFSRFSRALFGAALVLLIGCDTSTGPDPEPLPPSVVQVVSGGTQEGAVGQALPQPLVVKVLDARGDPVAGQRVLFAVTSGGGSVSPGEAVTLSDGTAQTAWTLGTSTAAEQRAEARVLSDAGAVLASVSFGATARAAVPVSITPVGEDTLTGPAGAALADSLSVLVRDAFGNPVAGAPVLWSVVRGGGVVSPASTTTGANGIARAAWTLGAALDSTQAVLAAAGVSLTTQFIATPTFPVGGAIEKVSGDNQTWFAGEPLPQPLVVRVRTALGIPLAGVRVTWSTTAGALSATSTVTDAQGRAQVQWTLGTSTAAEQRTDARVLAGDGTTVLASTSFAAMATAAQPASITRVGPEARTGAAGSTLDSLAVLVRDTHGNPVPGAPVLWSIVRGGGAVSPATTTTDAAGIARTAWTLGFALDSTQAVLAAAGVSLTTQFTATPTVPAGAALEIVSGNNQTSFPGDTLPGALVVRLRTSMGTPLTGATVASSSDAGTLFNTTSTTDAQGLAQARWVLGATPGVQSATAAVTGVGSAVFRANAQARVNLTVTAPASGASVSADSLVVTATASGDRAIQSVTATVDGRTVSLALSGGVWRGRLSLAGLAGGPKTLRVVATDVGGTTAERLVSFTRAVAPALTVQSPLDRPWATSNVRVAAQCPDCVTLRASVGSTVLATGTTELDSVVSLAAFASSLPQPAAVTITFTGTSASGGVTTRQVAVTVYRPSPVEWLTRAGNQVLDVSAQRILYVRQPGDVLWIRHRTTLDSTRIGPISGTVFQPASRTGPVVLPRTARLTPLGAIWADGLIESPPFGPEVDTVSRVREWRNGTLLELGRTGWSRHSLAVELPWAAWGEHNEVIRRDLNAGTSAVIATDRLSPPLDDASNRNAPGDVDVAANGDVVYVDDTYNIVRVRGGVPAKLTTDGSSSVQNRYPETDGSQVVFFRGTPGNAGEIWRITAGGARELLASGVFPSYEVNNGWVAYGSRTRSPGGAVQQWPGDVESLGPNGDVVYIAGGLRYRGRASDGSTAELPRADGYVTSFWRGTTGYLIINGEIFRILP